MIPHTRRNSADHHAACRDCDAAARVPVAVPAAELLTALLLRPEPAVGTTHRPWPSGAKWGANMRRLPATPRYCQRLARASDLAVSNIRRPSTTHCSSFASKMPGWSAPMLTAEPARHGCVARRCAIPRRSSPAREGRPRNDSVIAPIAGAHRTQMTGATSRVQSSVRSCRRSD